MTAEEFMMIIGLPVSFALLLIFWMWQTQQSKNRAKAKTQALEKSLTETAEKFFEEINRSNKFTPVETSLNLDNNEFAIYSSRSTMAEYKSQRRFNAVGTTLKFGGVPVHLGHSRGESHNVLRDMGTGTLTITNKRLIFIGSEKSWNSPLREILNSEISIDTITIFSSKRQAPYIFTASNPLIIKILISVLPKLDVNSSDDSVRINLT